VVFFLTGMWHGASWSFIVWGLFHGFFLIVERLGFHKILNKLGVFSHIYTLLIVMLAWVFFRIEHIDDALAYIGLLFGFGSQTILAFQPNNEQWFIMIIGIFFSLNGLSLIEKLNAKTIRLERYNALSEILGSIGLLFLFFFCVMALSSNAYNPFIYYRF